MSVAALPADARHGSGRAWLAWLPPLLGLAAVALWLWWRDRQALQELAVGRGVVAGWSLLTVSIALDRLLAVVLPRPRDGSR